MKACGRSTNRQETLAQLEFERDVEFPDILKTLRARLVLLRQYSARGAEEARIARDVVFFCESAVKAALGRR